MKGVFFLILFVFIFTGCTGKWAANELPEADISGISIMNKVPLNIRGKVNVTHSKMDSMQGLLSKGKMRIQGGGFNYSHEIVEISEFDKALQTSITSSNYFNLQNSSDVAYSIDVSLSSPDYHLYFLGFLGYFGSLATIPFPIDGKDFQCDIKLYAPNGNLLKSYTYLEVVDSTLTVMSPLAAFMSNPKDEVVQVLMDKYISNFIKDIERDELIQYSDSKKI